MGHLRQSEPLLIQYYGNNNYMGFFILTEANSLSKPNAAWIKTFKTEKQQKQVVMTTVYSQLI